jgi:predicted metal-binding protein
MTAILSVCVTCRRTDSDPEDGTRPGAHLRHALDALDCPEGVEIRSVECLSACNNGCAVALSAPGKWSYVYGRMSPENASDILAGSAAYAATTDGLVPWRARPVIFRKQSLARIPPLSANPDPEE